MRKLRMRKVLAAATSLLALSVAQGRAQEVIVGPGDPVGPHSADGPGRIVTVLPGAAASRLSASDGGHINMSGSLSNSSDATPFALTGTATATISGASITALRSGSFGLDFSLPSSNEVLAPKATVIDSEITADRVGARITGGTDHSVGGLEISNTRITATGASGLGVALFGANFIATNGSVVTGGVNGLFVTSGYSPGGWLISNVSSVVVDGSTIEGLSGSAIYFGGGDPVNASIADITIANGSQLIGGNGTILQVDSYGAVDFTVDNSALTGNITVDDTTSTADVTLRNGGSVTGDMTAISSLTMDRGGLIGNLDGRTDGSTTVGLANGSVIEGNLNNIASLNSAGSSITGDVNGRADGSTTATLADSVFRGSLNNIASLDADHSAITGDLTGNTAGTTTVQLSGGSAFDGTISDVASASLDASQFTGDINGKADGSTTVQLSNGSLLEGELNNVLSLDVNSQSVWRMIGSDSIANLSVNGGIVEISETGGSTFNTLTVDNLSGNGTFVLDTNLAAPEGDKLVVTGNASGDHQLLVRSTGTDPTSENRLTVVETNGGTASFGLVGDVVDLGTYRYVLRPDDNDWVLVGTGMVTPGTATIIGLASVSPTVWYGEADTLRSRMGDLRLDEGESAGLWMRTFGRGYGVRAGAGQAYDQNQWGVTLGVDTPIAVETGHLLVGAFAGYSKSSLDFDIGSSASVTSYHAGAYASWMQDNGWYVDGLLKLNRFSNDARVSLSDGTGASGDYNNIGIGGQIEVGRHIAGPDNWFF